MARVGDKLVDPLAAFDVAEAELNVREEEDKI